MSYKIKSYTLIEILISMIVVSIVVFITYSIFFSLTKQIREFTKNEETLLNYTLFKSSIKKDFFEAKKTTFIENEIALEYPNNIIRYKIKSEGLIIRNQSKNTQVDSFFINVIKIKPVYVPNLKKNIVTSIRLDLFMFKRETSLILQNKPAKDVLINSFFKDAD